jgi:hypothetical protein
LTSLRMRAYTTSPMGNFFEAVEDTSDGKDLADKRSGESDMPMYRVTLNEECIIRQGQNPLCMDISDTFEMLIIFFINKGKYFISYFHSFLIILIYKPSRILINT